MVVEAAGLPSSNELQRDKHYIVENVVVRVKLPQGEGSSSVSVLTPSLLVAEAVMVMIDM